MGEMSGMERPDLQALPQIGDRLTFLYLEHCQINREDSAILVRDGRGTTRIPAAAITVLLLGPGTTVTHRAIELIGDAGVGIVWIGEHGVRFYASGRPLTHRAQLLMKQAQLVSNQRTHLSEKCTSSASQGRTFRALRHNSCVAERGAVSGKRTAQRQKSRNYAEKGDMPE